MENAECNSAPALLHWVIVSNKYSFQNAVQNNTCLYSSSYTYPVSTPDQGIFATQGIIKTKVDKGSMYWDEEPDSMPLDDLPVKQPYRQEAATMNHSGKDFSWQHLGSPCIGSGPLNWLFFCNCHDHNKDNKQSCSQTSLKGP